MSGTTTSGGVAASQTDDLTFMRGLVMTDAQGLATFETVYPGTYEGRTPHIHVKVHNNNHTHLKLLVCAACEHKAVHGMT